MVSNVSRGHCFVLQLFNLWSHLILSTIEFNEAAEKMENEERCKNC